MSKCNYYRDSPITTYIPSCCVEDGFAFNDVHPYDVEDYCQFCGGKIKLVEHKRHPDLENSDE